MTRISKVDAVAHDKAVVRRERREEQQLARLQSKHRRVARRIEKMLLRHMKRSVRRGRQNFRAGKEPTGDAIFGRRMWRAMYFREYGRYPYGSISRYNTSLERTEAWNEVRTEAKLLQARFPGWSFCLSSQLLHWEGNDTLDGIIATHTPDN